jgi:RNA polymerase sigma-70 factor (ECF subfamily)
MRTDEQKDVNLVSDTEWVARARAGDERAFVALVERYQTPIFYLCLRMLGNPHEAEEAAQEAFLRAWTQFGRYDPNRSFKTWLFSIASHYCIDLLRKRRMTWLSVDEDDAEVPQIALQDPEPGPEGQASAGEFRAQLQTLLRRLQPEDRRVLVLRYWYDFSYDDIAATTGATVSAVKSRLHRAREALAVMLANAGIGSPSLMEV